MSAALAYQIEEAPSLDAANDNASLRSSALIKAVAYDGRGNVTSLGLMSFAYDTSDQPIIVTGSRNGVSFNNANYTYDGNLKRVKSTVNGRTFYNVYSLSGELVHVHDENPLDGGLPERADYITAGGMSIARVRAGQGIYYEHSDHLGSAVAQTYTSGGIATRMRYTPFGLTLDDPNLLKDQAGFTGHIKDSATGLNYMQARYYDPVIGRFLSIDPVTFLDTGEPAYFNRYSYTANDPVNLIDPNGECFASRLSSCAEQLESTFRKVSTYVTVGIKEAQNDPEGFEVGVGNGIANGASGTINGAVTVGEFANPNLSVGQLPDIPRIEGSSAAENVGMLVGETGFHAATTVAAGPKVVTGGAALANSAKGAAAGAGGKYGSLFGRGGKTHGGGFFNRNDYARIGYGWDNNRKQDVFRIAFGSKKNPNRFKIHLHRFKEPLPPKN